EAPRAEGVAPPSAGAVPGRAGERRATRATLGAPTRRFGVTLHQTHPAGEHDGEDQGGRGPRAGGDDRADERDERRGYDDPAQGRPVEREADGQATATREPWSQDDVDGGPAHGAPADGHHEEGRVELPRLPDGPQGGQTGRHGNASRGHDD